jgi:hypothetical protein
MSRLLIGNFDFEWSLGHPHVPAPTPLQRLSSELAHTWPAIAEPDDVLWLPDGIDADLWSSLQHELPWPLPQTCRRLSDAPRDAVVCPWGWTERVVNECQRAGLPLPPHPAIDVVRRINSRGFSHQLEEELGCGLPEATLQYGLSEVQATLRQYAASHPPGARWIIKADLSNSSRERLIGSSAELSPRDRTWLETRLRQGPLAFEPWVEIQAEAGLQWELPLECEPVLVGVVPLLTDAAGHYRGSVFATSEPVETIWSDAIAVTRIAAARIQAEGYFGPLGIDACRYRTGGGELRMRPLQDINARWTMGRLSLGWRRLLAPGETGVWRHGPPEAVLRSATVLLPAMPDRLIVTSPSALSERPTRLRHQLEIHRAPIPD